MSLPWYRREHGDGEQAAVGEERPPLPPRHRTPVRTGASLPCPPAWRRRSDPRPSPARRRPGTSPRSRCVRRGCRRWTAPQMVAANHPADEHRHALGAVALAGVLGDPGLGGDEDQSVADPRKHAPGDESRRSSPGPGTYRSSRQPPARDSHQEHPPCPRSGRRSCRRTVIMTAAASMNRVIGRPISNSFETDPCPPG